MSMYHDVPVGKREHYEEAKQATPPRVEMELQVLRKRQDELDATLETLELRLTPILKRSNVSTGAGKISETVRTLTDGTSPLAENIIVCGDRIEIITKRIQDILQLLEV